MTRGGLNTKIHAIVGNDLRAAAFLLSAGNVEDCTEAVPLLKELSCLKDCNILADKAYGTKGIREYLHEQSAKYTIPPKVNVKHPWPFDKEVYKHRNVVERFFNRLCSKNSVNATSVTKSEISRFRSRRPLPPDPYCSAPTQPPPLAAAWPWQVIGKNAKLNRRRDTFVSEISEFRHRRRD